MTSKSIEEETNGRDRAKALTERVFRRVDEMSRMLDQKALEKKREAVLRGDLLVGGVPSAALSRTPSRVDKGESGSRRHRRFDRKTLLSATTAQVRFHIVALSPRDSSDHVVPCRRTPRLARSTEITIGIVKVVGH